MHTINLSENLSLTHTHPLPVLYSESQHLGVFGQNSPHYFFDATLFGDGQATLQQDINRSPFTSLAFNQISTTFEIRLGQRS